MTARKSVLRPIRSFGVGFGLFALLLQLMLPIGLAIASDGQGDTGRFGLCLSNDGRRLFLGFDEQSEPSRSYDCPLCISAKIASAALPPTDVVVLAMPTARIFHHPPLANTRYSTLETNLRPWIRGPPAL